MVKNILVVDDERSIRDILSAALKDEGFRVRLASNGQEGIDLVRAERPDVILLDIWMPEMDGLEALKLIKNEWPDQPVVMMSGHGNIETAVKATKLGAFDFVEKPLSLERLLVLIQNVGQIQDLTRENQALRKQVEKTKHLIGTSPGMKLIHDMIKRVAPTTGSVLITGENGTGKELVAQSLHAQSSRFSKPFIEVNCAAIPEELIESELFGHEKGAFTGATQLRRGKFDLANCGTLFLDEIGDMSLKTQAKILRILQEQKFERVGGSQTITVDVRIVAATNKDLKAEIQRGSFREDLYYRLNVVPFQLPALRDRKDDITDLAKHFLKDFARIHDRKERELLPEAFRVLTEYSWPGNVRELKNLMERLMILTPLEAEGSKISAADLFQFLEGVSISETESVSEDTGPNKSIAVNLKDARQEFEKDFILKTLKENDFNVSKTAQVLGVERSHLHRKIKSFGIDVKDLS